MKQMARVETLLQSFTTFASTMLTSFTHKYEIDKISLITPSHLAPHYPRVFILNQMAEQVERDKVLEIQPNMSQAKMEGDDVKNLLDDSKGQPNTKGESKPVEGTISCIYLR
mmetsp:Transcript_2641/g.4412  ORF Transcript_2641/g.4412 Transcript_2641/m.4412 type:complete len:112 (+) Transcript_2641:351-686(+)